jgi:hypothetical protein
LGLWTAGSTGRCETAAAGTPLEANWVELLLDHERRLADGQELPRLELPALGRLQLQMELEEAENAPLLSAEELAANPGFFSSAFVKFDKARNLWTASWSRPSPLHFGMLLRPELLKRVEVGRALSFESREGAASLTKTEANELIMVKESGEKSRLSASDVLHLLQGRIETGGLSLFVDKAGNLILQAQGQQARMLAQIKARS